MPFFQMRLEAERQVRAIRRQIKPYKPIDMSEIRKTKFTKAIESLRLLSTKEKLEADELLREMIAQDIKEENAVLSQKRSDNDEILELLKK